MVENLKGVGIQGNNIFILFPNRSLTQSEAINMAAWIVALTSKDEFEKVYKEVRAT